MLSARRILLASRKGQGRGSKAAASSSSAAPKGRERSSSGNRGDRRHHHDNNNKHRSNSNSSGRGRPSLSQKPSVNMSSLMHKGHVEAVEERTGKKSSSLTNSTNTSTPTPTNATPPASPSPPRKFAFSFGESPAERQAREDAKAPSSFGGRSLDGSRIPTEGEAARDFAEKMGEASQHSVVPEDTKPIYHGQQQSSPGAKSAPSTLGLFCKQWKYSVLNPSTETRTTVLGELADLEKAFLALPVEDNKSPSGALRARKEGQLMMAKLRAGITFQMTEDYYGPSISWLTVHFKRLSDEDFAMALHDIHCLAGHIQDPNLTHSHSTLQELMELKMKEGADSMNATLSPISRLATVFHYINKTHSKIPSQLRVQIVSDLVDGKILVEASKETDPKRMVAIGLMALSVQSIISAETDAKHTLQILDSVVAKYPDLSVEIHPDDLPTILRSLRLKRAAAGRKLVLTEGLMSYCLSTDYECLYQILTWSFVNASERAMIINALGDCSQLEELRVAVAAANFTGPGNNVAVRRGIELLLGSGDQAAEGADDEGGDDQGEAAEEEPVYFGEDGYEGYEETNTRHGALTEEQNEDYAQTTSDEEGLAYLVMKCLCHKDVPETKQILCLFAQPTITKELNMASLGCMHLVTRFLALVESGLHLSEDELYQMAPPDQEVHERIQISYSTDNVLLRWSLGMISGSFDVSIEPLINKLSQAQLSLALLQVSRVHQQLTTIKDAVSKGNPRLSDDIDSIVDMLVEMGERFAVKYMGHSTRASPLVTRRSVVLRLPMELASAQTLAIQFVAGAAGVWSAAVALREVLPIAIQEPVNPVLVARTVALIQRTELPRDPFSLFYSADDGPSILKNVSTLVQHHARLSPDSQVGPSVLNRVARWYATFLSMVEAGIVEHPEWMTSSPPAMLDVEENAAGFSDLFQAPPQVAPRPWHIEEVLSVLFQARASIPAELNAFVKKNVWEIFYGESDSCAKLLAEFPEGIPRRFTSHYVAALRSQILNHMDLSPRNIGLMLDTSQASGFPLLLLSVEQAGGDTIPVLRRVVECPSPTCALVLRVWGAAPSHSSRTFLNDPSYPDILALLETISERIVGDDACQLLRSPSHIMQLPPSVVELLWNSTDEALLATSEAEAAAAKTPESTPSASTGDIAVPLSKPKMQGLPQPECLLSIAIKVPDLADDICMTLAGRQVNFVHLLCNMQAKVPIQFVNCAMEQCCKQIARAKPVEVVAPPPAPEVPDVVLVAEAKPADAPPTEEIEAATATEFITESEATTDEIANEDTIEAATSGTEAESALEAESAPDAEAATMEISKEEPVTPTVTPVNEKPAVLSPNKHLDTSLSATAAGVFGTGVRLLKYLDQHVFTFEGIVDVPLDTLLLFTRLLQSFSELPRGAPIEVEAMLLTSGRIYGRLLRRRFEVEELLGLEPTIPQRVRGRAPVKRMLNPHLVRTTQSEEELTQTLAALNGVISSNSAIIDAFVKFDATTPERLQRTFGTVPQSMKRLMMDIKLEDLVVDAIMALPQNIYKAPKKPETSKADTAEEQAALEEEEEEVRIPRALNATTSARLYQYIEALERNNVYQDKAQAAVVKVVTRPLVEVYRRAIGQAVFEVPDAERKKVHAAQVAHIEYAISILRSSLRGGASDETIAKVTRGLILAGHTFKAGANQTTTSGTTPSTSESAGGTTVVDHLGRLLQVFLDAPVKSKAHKLVVEALMSDEVVPELTGPWFAKITVAMSRLGSLGDFRDRIGSLLGRLFAAADPHSQTLIFRALSADEQIVKNNLDLLFDVIERSVAVLSPEDLENVASALTQTSSFIAFADVEDLVEQLCVRVLAVIEVAKKSSLVRILHLLTHFKLQDVGVLEAIYTSLEDKMPKLDVNQLLTILSSMVELDMIPREKLILQVVKRLETNVDSMSPQHVVHTLSHLVDLNVAFLPVTNSLFMKANESKDAIRQSKTLQSLMEKAATEFIIEAPEHVTRHFLKKQKERTRMRALFDFNLEKKQRRQREVEDAAKQ